MSKVKELVDKLNELNINQTDMDWRGDIPKEIWDEFFEGKYVELARGLEVDKHRWYETSTTVIEFEQDEVEHDNQYVAHIVKGTTGGIVGINHVNDLFSESMSVDDCDENLTFSVMKPITKVTYVDV